MLLSNVTQHLTNYESTGLHYHLAAIGIYEARKRIIDVFSDHYRPYIIAGLLAYDMARQLGKDPYHKFSTKLENKLNAIQAIISPLMDCSLATLDISAERESIIKAYTLLSDKGNTGLHSDNSCAFFVGASKILHWLNPDMFLVLDSHIALAFRNNQDPRAQKATYRNGAPAYSGEIYAECLICAQNEIREYGEERLRQDGKGLPIANIFGNVAFQIGTKKERDR